MKVFFDTNVYVAEALLGDAAGRMLEATSRASWRIFSSSHALAEIERVMVERYFGGDARSWLNLQAGYDLRVAEIANAKRIEREIAPATT